MNNSQNYLEIGEENSMKICLLSFIFSFLLLLECACSGKQQEYSDYFEGFNRSMYNFNSNVLDLYLIHPIAVVWRNYIPQPARNGINNFICNLEEPAIMVNSLLQGKPYKGMVHFTRFFLNSIFGIGGFFDFSGILNQKLQREQPHRFGSTLGHYNIGYGPYLYLPFYGSFTLRDDAGNLIDMLYPPLSWLTFPLSVSKWMIEGIETHAQLLDFEELLCKSSDPYIMTRESYFQYHDFIANDEKINVKEIPNVNFIENSLSEIDIK